MAAFWVKWSIVALLAANALATVAVVGKPRRPLVGSDAAGIVFWYAAIAVLIAVFWRTR